MKKSYRPILVLLLIFLAIGALSTCSAGGKDLIPWRTDFGAAQAESAKTHKPLMLYFTASWCGPCQSLKRTTWNDAKVEQALQSYVPVKIDVDEHQDLALRYAVDGMPMFALLDDHGNVTRSETGALPSEEFLSWLRGRDLSSH